MKDRLEEIEAIPIPRHEPWRLVAALACLALVGLIWWLGLLDQA
jgi:hypothetical protein